MLLKGYRKEFCLPPNPEARHLRCYAHLNEDISEVLPYLNTVLGGYQYCEEPPSLTLKLPGKLITLYSNMIAINILKDEAEADHILVWLQEKINNTWDRREQIEPSFKRAPQPRIIDILRLLPKTNCRECGHPTCMVFASMVSEGTGTPDDCPSLDGHAKRKLKEYLSHYKQGQAGVEIAAG
jgi:ArsR family metal-binding transcriptional regulator